MSRVMRAGVVGLERAAAALRLGYCGAVRRWAGAIAGLLGRAGGLILRRSGELWMDERHWVLWNNKS